VLVPKLEYSIRQYAKNERSRNLARGHSSLFDRTAWGKEVNYTV
jgi:hypothetical protein